MPESQMWCMIAEKHPKHFTPNALGGNSCGGGTPLAEHMESFTPSFVALRRAWVIQYPPERKAVAEAEFERGMAAFEEQVRARLAEQSLVTMGCCKA